MSAGCADLSSLIYWSDAEVNPIGLLVTYSGSTGNRLLFWHSSRQAAVTEVAVTTPVSTAAPATLATASTISVSEPQAAAPSLGAPSVSNAHLAGPSNAVGASSTYAGITTIMTNSSSGALMRLGMASSSSLLSDAPEKGPDFSSLVPSANPYALSLILNKPTSSILANLNPTSGGALFGSGGGITAITGLVPGNPSIPSVCPTPYPSSHQSHSTSTPAAILTTYSSQQHGPTDSASVVPPAGMLIGFPGESHASVHLLNHQHHHTHNPQPHPVGVETKVASPFGQTGRSDRERDWERERERDRDQHRNRDRVRPPIRHTLRPEESLPASALLSLLHSCSNQVQKKIFLKVTGIANPKLAIFPKFNDILSIKIGEIGS
ncbi:unnamed protein product [Protopolystoma xenopodis]|uniref:Uncharacterized protein n=1 Tax=Protopolystoma xenopodis TaxID=117903 RepID=A0A3S5CLN9_9PLAT|nr:unnamed protein product [Protopolystoma xenopodis]